MSRAEKNILFFPFVFGFNGVALYNVSLGKNFIYFFQVEITSLQFLAFLRLAMFVHYVAFLALYHQIWDYTGNISKLRNYLVSVKKKFTFLSVCPKC